MQPRLLGKEFLADHESKLNIKTENFFYAKDIIKRFKKQAIDWEKIFANHTLTKKKSEYIKNSQDTGVKIFFYARSRNRAWTYLPG